MGNEIEMHAIIHGRVQGVGFRASAVHYAEQLDLKGTIRNCPDDTVEVHAQGEKINLNTFLDRLKQTFHILSIDIEYSSTSKLYNGFKIVY